MKDWQALTRLLLEALGDHVEQQGRPTWVLVLDEPDDPTGERFALALSDEPGGPLGYAAPPECQAVGVVATGREVIGKRYKGGRSWPPSGKARLACLVSREGEIGSVLGRPDGEVITSPPEGGDLIEALRDCFDPVERPAATHAARVPSITPMRTAGG